MRSGFETFGDLLWPPRCLVTGAPIQRAGAITPEAWGALRFLGDPQCAACGWPFEAVLGPDSLCAACEAKRPRVTRTRAALAYDDASRQMILRFKHAAARVAVTTFASWMARAGGTLLDEADLLIPVPLHPRRSLTRGYNQSAWLATSLAQRTGVPVMADCLLRKRNTGSQAGLSASARLRNVAGAFVANPSRVARLEGRRVLLIDDVRTTGATLDACALALNRAGAANVDALCLARVVRPERTHI